MGAYTDQEMDEYIAQLLAEMQIPDPVQKVVRNILDESIPEAMKERLLIPLLPNKYRPTAPPRAKRGRRRKTLLEEFDPLPLIIAHFWSGLPLFRLPFFGLPNI